MTEGRAGKCEAPMENNDSQNTKVGEMLEVRGMDHRQVVALQISVGTRTVYQLFACISLNNQLDGKEQGTLHIPLQWMVIYQ